MENASKALIIAGAILISIVLVSVGVLVVQNLNPDEALSQMDQQAVDSFNSKFVGSDGTSVRGTVVKSLLSNVITSNGANEDSLRISVTCTNSTEPAKNCANTKESTAISTARAAVNTSHRFTVNFGYATDGRVNSVTIKDNSLTTTNP